LRSLNDKEESFIILVPAPEPSYQPAPASSYVQQEPEKEDWPVGPGVNAIIFFLVSLRLQENKLDCLTVASHL
jgi:hypothetical protein